MSKIIALVQYPPEEKFTDDRKYFTNMDNILGGNWVGVECFTLKYTHHYWHNYGKDLEMGAKCICGKEIYNG